MIDITVCTRGMVEFYFKEYLDMEPLYVSNVTKNSDKFNCFIKSKYTSTGISWWNKGISIKIKSEMIRNTEPLNVFISRRW